MSCRLEGPEQADRRTQGDAVTLTLLTALRGWCAVMCRSVPRSRELTYAIRVLARSRWYAASGIGVIALGSALSLTVFAIVDGVLFKPLPYRDPDRLLSITARLHGRGVYSVLTFKPEDLEEWTRIVPDLGITGFSGSPSLFLGPDDLSPVSAAIVDARLFDVLGIAPLIGGFTSEHFQTPSAAAARPTILLHEVWRTRFGADSSVVGQRLSIDDGRSLLIVGVMPRGFTLPFTQDADLLFPMTRHSSSGFDEVIVRVPDGRPLPLVREQLDATIRRLGFASTPAGAPPGPVSRRDTGERQLRIRVLPLATALTPQLRARSEVLAAIGTLLLGLSCTSLAGLMIARAYQRHVDLLVRRTLGADGPALVREVLAETFVLVICGVAVGFAFASAGLSAILHLVPPEIAALGSVELGGRAALVGLAAIGLCTPLVAVWPVRQALRTHRTIGGSGVGMTSRVRSFSRALVAIQVACGTALTISASPIVGTMLQLWSGDLGFETDNVLAAELRLRRPAAALQAELDEILAKARSVEGVTAVGLADVGVLNGRTSRVQLAPPLGGHLPFDVYQQVVTHGVLEALRPVVLAGVLPLPEEFEYERRTLVSESVARAYWPAGDAIGQTFRLAGGEQFQVAAVVADARLVTVTHEALPFVYLPYRHFGRSTSPMLIVRTSGRGDPGAGLRAHLQSSGPSIRAARWWRLDDRLADSVSTYTFRGWLFGSIAASCLLILAVGLFGLLAMMTARRRREVGVRMALGASPWRVIRLLVHEQATGLFSGLFAGALIAAWAVTYLKSQIHGVTIYDVRLWTTAGLLVLVAAGVGVLLPALRTSKTDPMTALRAE